MLLRVKQEVILMLMAMSPLATTYDFYFTMLATQMHAVGIGYF